MSTAPRKRTTLPLIIAVVVVAIVVMVTILLRDRQGELVDTAAGPLVNASTDAPGASDLQRRSGESVRPALSRQDSQAVALRSVELRRDARKASIERSEVLRTRVAAQFDAEKIDPAWAPGKQVDLEKISNLPQITTAVSAPKSMSVSCRSSMCRIDSAFDSNGNAEDWAMVYMASVGSALPKAVMSRVQNPDGTTSVRIYGQGR